jgi:hypothetical protein
MSTRILVGAIFDRGSPPHCQDYWLGSRAVRRGVGSTESARGLRRRRNPRSRLDLPFHGWRSKSDCSRRVDSLEFAKGPDTSVSKSAPGGLHYLEVTGIVEDSFLGIRYTTLHAHPRHIQRGSLLERAGSFGGTHGGARKFSGILATPANGATCPGNLGLQRNGVFMRSTTATATVPLSTPACRNTAPGIRS